MIYFWITLAAMFTVMAMKAAVKKNDSTPWATTMRRIDLVVTATSETCNVMPMTKEK